MSAGPQTSQARYAPTASPDDNLDFCNGLWGVDDEGVDILFTRMRTAARTIDELRSFWKERSAIEEEYAKRLAKLAQMPIGRDEIGKLRSLFDTLSLETNKQAGVHSQLAQYIQTDLESPVGVFASRQQDHKISHQVPIEKEFKVKKTREQHVSKAREKYESDCLQIKSFTAQSGFVLGKDLEKIHLKLELAQEAVQISENDYAHFASVLQEAMRNWEQDWKAFCDTCQDLEERRIEFMKTNVSAYANSIWAVCESDIGSCEKICLVLDELEPEKDTQNFVRDYGTGNAISVPLAFVNHANIDALPVSSSRVATRPSNFVRSTQRVNRGGMLQQGEELHDVTNHAGVDAGSPPCSVSTNILPLSRSATQRSTGSSHSPANGVSGYMSPTRELQRRQSMAAGHPRPAPCGDPGDPSVSNTQLDIGDRAWDVDPNKDPQKQKAARPRTSTPVEEQDPLVKQMAELSTAAAAGGTLRRNTIRQGGLPPASVLPSTSDIPVEQVVSGCQRPIPTSPRRGPSPATTGSHNHGPPAPSTTPKDGALQHGIPVSCHPVTPTNLVGIPLGSDGRVVHDVMAQPMRQGLTYHIQGGLPAPQAAQSPQAYSVHRDTNRAPTHAQHQAPTAHNNYKAVPSSAYDESPPYHYGHVHGDESPPRYQHIHALSPASSPTQACGQLAQSAGYTDAETRSVYHGHQQDQSVGHVASVQQREGHAGHAESAGTVYQPAGPGAERSPSPAVPRGQVPPPTGAYTDDGRPILFYVTALYDYSAMDDDQFCFQAGDIIAVTDTPDDGWWSGELLDDRRRLDRRNVFPSNFVCLF